jgi:bifunctional ADP-heptose synthase (sugar kinase/adenylyltransferase)
MGFSKDKPNVTLQQYEFPLVEKTRYISAKKKERLFESVRFLNGKNFALAAHVDELVQQKDYSAVLIYDFGHGFFDGAALMEANPNHFYAINVQANSTNYPFNDVKKYKNFNLLAIDERELRLTMRDNKSNVADLIENFLELSPMVDSAYYFFTLGDRGAWAYHKGEKIFCPALVASVVDATGSGDVFHAMATLFIISGIDLGTTLFFASLYAGLYAQIEGHDGTLAKTQIIRAIAAMQ